MPGILKSLLRFIHTTNHVYYIHRNILCLTQTDHCVIFSVMLSFYLKKRVHTNVGHDHKTYLRRKWRDHTFTVCLYTVVRQNTLQVSLCCTAQIRLSVTCLMQHILPRYSAFETLWWSVQQVYATFIISVFFPISTIKNNRPHTSKTDKDWASSKL